jgi:hypothetical protein
MEYRYGSHTVFQIEYHFVWVTKYRYKGLYAQTAENYASLLNNDFVGQIIFREFRYDCQVLSYFSPEKYTNCSCLIRCLCSSK